ncbi:hypothetical protein [Amycolatopsis anabasis]|uniref:hypothetical protein n=1 Tax=Amycolatopsis anabasis TaxID=1840409 RepID=UPI00131A7E8A|nr:hypothetical protein [Amycolatopsis anabasis]
MTTTEKTAPDVLADLAAVSRRYRGTFDWPTTVDTSGTRLELPIGETVDALVMRAAFGGEVNALLRMHLVTGPIIGIPGDPADWIFLTRPRTEMSEKTREDLLRADVGWKPLGATISLPPSLLPRGRVRWIDRPVAGRPLPPWSTVVAMARAALFAGRGW